MINNYWEELNMSNDVLEFHEKELKKFDLPKWVFIDCPYCKEKFSNRSIREIGIKYNSRNIGDIFVEFCCDKCKKMNTIYYRKEIENTKEFISFLNNEKIPKSEPLLEEDMYKLKYNNLIDRMIK